jgi:RimJ/RimL family protein N-acetyltransferase
MERTLRFRRMEADDLRLVHEWLQRPHVRRWWRDRETYEGVVEQYLPAIEGDDPTDHYLAFLGEEPIGFVEPEDGQIHTLVRRDRVVPSS